MSFNANLSGSQRGQRKRRRHFLALRPIMIRMAFETPRLRMFRPRRMALLASRNPRQQNIASLRARKRFRMATHAGKSRVR